MLGEYYATLVRVMFDDMSKQYKKSAYVTADHLVCLS